MCIITLLFKICHSFFAVEHRQADIFIEKLNQRAGAAGQAGQHHASCQEQGEARGEEI